MVLIQNGSLFTPDKIRHMKLQSVAVVDFPETMLAILEHRGNPRLIEHSVQKFIEWRRRNNLPPSVSATFNILYNDPAEVPSENFRLDLCAAVNQKVSDPEYGIVSGTIPSGRCAVLRHIGTEDTLGESIWLLCAQWLPTSGEKRRDFPIFLQRVKFIPEVPEIESVTDIFLPIL
jgi:AraC family transcriptional regulator